MIKRYNMGYDEKLHPAEPDDYQRLHFNCLWCKSRDVEPIEKERDELREENERLKERLEMADKILEKLKTESNEYWEIIPK